MIYLIIIFLLLIFILRYDINGKTQYRNQCYFMMLVAFILLAGLRYRLGIDTTRYLSRFYYDTPELHELSWNDLKFGKDFLFTLLNSVVLTLGGKFYVVQLIHSAFVNALFFKYIKKHTDAIFLSIFIYFIYQYALINMEEMRASMSLVICLFANDYILDKKWIKALSLYAIGCFFHSSTIIVLLMSLFFFLRFNKFGVAVLAAALVFGFIAQSFLENYLALMAVSDTLNDKIASYVNDESYMETRKNIIGYMISMVIYGYAIISLLYVKKGKIEGRLMRLEPLMMVFLIFAMVNIGMPIAYRFVRFYVVYYILFISEFMIYLFTRDGRLGRYVVYAKAFAIMFPLFLLIARGRLQEETWVRYHPYSSIFDQKLDKKRELQYSSYNGGHPGFDKY